MKKFFYPIAISAMLCFTNTQALEFPLPPPGHDIVGQVQTIQTIQGDTLSSLGIKYDIGYYEMVEANPGLPRNGKIKPGTSVTIPSRFLLPSQRDGLVINLAELRAYFYPKNNAVVYTFPIGAGREGWNTPKVTTTVIRKKEDPVWIVPDSIMNESIRLGKRIKKYYLPGPDNPLGKYALYLNIPGIRIHGTNLPATVGKRISHGCIRLLPDDIKFLYENVPVGTITRIVHEQNKAGWDGPILYLESEVPFKEYHDSESAEQAIQQATENHPAIVDQQRVEEVVEEQTGIPTAIGHDSSVNQIPE